MKPKEEEETEGIRVLIERDSWAISSIFFVFDKWSNKSKEVESAAWLEDMKRTVHSRSQWKQLLDMSSV